MNGTHQHEKLFYPSHVSSDTLPAAVALYPSIGESVLMHPLFTFLICACRRIYARDHRHIVGVDMNFHITIGGNLNPFVFPISYPFLPAP